MQKATHPLKFPFLPSLLAHLECGVWKKKRKKPTTLKQGKVRKSFPFQSKSKQPDERVNERTRDPSTRRAALFSIASSTHDNYYPILPLAIPVASVLRSISSAGVFHSSRAAMKRREFPSGGPNLRVFVSVGTLVGKQASDWGAPPPVCSSSSSWS